MNKRTFDKIYLRMTAVHEVGHAFYYIRNDWEFQYISLEGNELKLGYVEAPDFGDETILWSRLVLQYFNPSNKSIDIRKLKLKLKQYIEICISGRLCQLYYLFRNKDIVLEDFFSDYEGLSNEIQFCKIVDDLIYTKKVPDLLNKRKKNRIFAGFNEGMIYYNENYEEFDRDFLLSYLALTLVYKRNEKVIMSYYKRTAKRLLKTIEQNFEMIDKLASFLVKEKELYYEEFYRYYSKLNS